MRVRVTTFCFDHIRKFIVRYIIDISWRESEGLQKREREKRERQRYVDCLLHRLRGFFLSSFHHNCVHIVGAFLFDHLL